MPETRCDVLVVGASLCGGAAAKRLVDAGFHTIVIDRKELPRHKICSGIISPRGYRFLVENFGEPPDEAFHVPKHVTGVNFLFRNGLQMPMDFLEGPTPHIYRKFADYHVVKKSGAEIHTRTEFLDLETHPDHVIVKTNRETFRARYVVAADGPRSTVVTKLDPNFRDRIYWFVVGQKYYKGELDLDPDYFHFTIHPRLGYYNWSHPENGMHIIGHTCEHGDSWPDGHAKVVDYFRRHHGFRQTEEVSREGCIENFGMSLTNHFVFGRDRVLVAGQAAGFLNMMAEGMSCALHSGAIAGESIVEAMTRNRDANALYRDLVQSERRRTVDQWNPVRILFDNPHEADLKAAVQKLPLTDRLFVVQEMLAFCGQFHGYQWMAPILSASVKRLLTGRY